MPRRRRERGRGPDFTQRRATPHHGCTYSPTLAASERITWRVEDVIGGDPVRVPAFLKFAAEMLATRDETLEGKVCLGSGSGNVAQYTVEKLLELGARPVTLSESSGYVHDEAGIDRQKLDFVLELKNVRRGRIAEYAERYRTAVYVPADPSLGHNPLCGPAKAANAGGVATSGLEVQQISMRTSWTWEEVDRRLHAIMRAIHRACRDTAEQFGVPGNYVHGANIAGFVKVADVMLDQGLV